MLEIKNPIWKGPVDHSVLNLPQREDLIKFKFCNQNSISFTIDENWNRRQPFLAQNNNVLSIEKIVNIHYYGKLVVST